MELNMYDMMCEEFGDIGTVKVTKDFCRTI